MKEINSTSMDMLMLGAWSSCYYITNKAARILLSHAQEGFKHHPADFYKFECIQNGLITGHIGPIILHQDPNHGSFLDFEVNELYQKKYCRPMNARLTNFLVMLKTR